MNLKWRWRQWIARAGDVERSRNQRSALNRHIFFLLIFSLFLLCHNWVHFSESKMEVEAGDAERGRNQRSALDGRAFLSLLFF